MPGFGDVVVVVPVLNEEEALGRVLDELLGVGIPAERVLVIDGGSSDGSREVAASRGVRVVLQEGEGKAGAVRTAARLVDSRFVLFMDGDYSYPARYAPVLLEAARRGGYDLVIGARRFSRSSQPLLYRLGNRLLTWFFNTLFGSSLSDVLSGMYVVRSRVLREMLFEARGFGVETEIAAHVVSTTGRVAEIPIEYRRRLGRKKLRAWHGASILKEMVRLAWRYNPTFIMLSAAATLLLPGLLLGLWALRQMLLGASPQPYQLLAALALVLTGLVSLALSILSLYLKRMEYRLLRRIRSLEEKLSPEEQA